MDKNNFHFKIRDMSVHELVGLVESYNGYIKEHNKAICAECAAITMEKFLERKDWKRKWKI